MNSASLEYPLALRISEILSASFGKYRLTGSAEVNAPAITSP
jgi:hypothetical protein